MKIIQNGLTICTVAMLAACGGSGGETVDENPAAEAPTPTDSGSTPFISGTAAGAVESNLALNGRFSCEDDGMGDIVAEIIGTGANSEQLAIALPYDSGGEGEFELTGSDDARMQQGDFVQVRYRSTERQSFENGSGALTITEWPAAGGEPINGSFTASLTDGDETVELEGTISGSALREFSCLG